MGFCQVAAFLLPLAFIVVGATYDLGQPDQLTTADVETSLISELMGHVQNRGSAKLEEALNSIFASLPKNAHGNLGGPATRHALHHWFAQHHGWSVKGLELQGKGMPAASPDARGAWVPQHLQGLLEQRLAGRGVGLGELAVLVAALERLASQEVAARLEAAYHALGHPTTGRLGQDAVVAAVRKSLMHSPAGNSSAPMLEAAEAWLRSVREVEPGQGLDFAAATKVAAALVSGLERLQRRQCTRLKAALLEMEGPLAGRVRLADFVQQFEEGVETLRTMGVLDEADPGEPMVLIPNYMGMQSQCLEVSSLYSVCCRSESEKLLQQLEFEVSAAATTPSRLVEVIGRLSSSTVEAPRRLHPLLVQRLEAMANANGGQVPLHDSAFGRWMGFAFPREWPVLRQEGGGATGGTEAPQWQGAVELLRKPRSLAAAARKMLEDAASAAPLVEIPNWVLGAIVALTAFLQFLLARGTFDFGTRGKAVHAQADPSEQAQATAGPIETAEAHPCKKALNSSGWAAPLLVLLLTGATAAGLLDVTVLASALAAGLAMLTAVHFMPSHSSAAKGKEA